MYTFHSDDIVRRYKNKLEFKYTILNLFMKFTLNKITQEYISNLLNDDSNKIMFYCFDDIFDIENCPTLLVYNKELNEQNGKSNYYILLICTTFKFRNLGYASLLLNGFIEYIKGLNKINANANIILSSVEEAVTFYESYGFKWTRENLTNYPVLMEHEKYEEGKEYFILKLVV
jgi:GNAT superfamily N-acetyltransferase